MEIDIEIDGLTNCLVDRETGRQYDTEYRLVAKTISKSEADALREQGWLFDWSIPHRNGYEVYELMVKDDETIQGMIALKHFRSQYYTHVDIVESAPHNRGALKKYKGVGAHLFAIACKLSWDVGNEGYVQFKAKTNLVNHYKEILGAQNIDGQNMFIDTYNALKLIDTYFNNEKL